MLHEVLLHEISKNLEGNQSVKQVCVCHPTTVYGSTALEVILPCLPEENLDCFLQKFDIPSSLPTHPREKLHSVYLSRK